MSRKEYIRKEFPRVFKILVEAEIQKNKYVHHDRLIKLSIQILNAVHVRTEDL